MSEPRAKSIRALLLFTVLLVMVGVGYFQGAFTPKRFDQITTSDVKSAELVSLQEVFVQADISMPTEMVPVPGKNIFLLTEQPGLLKLLDPNSEATAPVLLDLSERMAKGSELGLLGVDCHPRWADNGEIFLNYTLDEPLRTVVARWKLQPGTMELATDSEEIILEIPQPATNHNGGKIAFGPDGMLYIALGDGGRGGDPWGNGQNRESLLGSILRIDVNNTDPGKNYAVPQDNPFADPSLGYRGEIWAWGLRNPWKFSFDESNGELWAGDVGQNKLEEIDLIVKGGNYGWNTFEGRSRYRTDSEPTGEEIDPLYQYTHEQGRSVTGGFVYRGDDLPFQGKYFFADFFSGKIWSFDRNSGVRLLLDTEENISSFARDNQRELYILTYPGKIFKLLPAKGPS